MAETLAGASPAIDTQILVAGAGSTGIAAALAFANAGWRVTLAGRFPPPLPGRTIALFEASVRFLDSIGVLEKVRAAACPIETIQMVDDTDQLLPVPDLVMRSEEIDLPAFGLNVSNDELTAILLEHARATQGFEIIESDIADYEFEDDGAAAILADGRRIEADFIVAADGRGSKARAAAGIDTKEWTYPQVALTALLRHELPHDNVSTEFHTRSGPFTLVPLPPREGAEHRSSLVWLMSPRDAKRRLAKPRDELQYEMEDYSREKLGSITIESGIGEFRMGGLQVSRLTAPRLALVGETCHVFPPIGAQGLNLSLRDVADLEDCLASVDLRNPKELARALMRYEVHRRADIGFRTHGVDLLNRSLIVPYLPIDLLRGAGFIAMTALGPLRRAVMREGVAPHLAQPRLMRDEAPKEPRMRGKRPRGPEALVDAAKGAFAHLRETASRLG
ncbi:2-octaprenyl-6-methoxyphenol hydroxylase [Methylosinus sp. sav-2]|uniref:FAD-dependent monooxygenase n=1 Tax=Methylosinus sp. sav-2 TaxID=2485168 RepID=UPI00047BA0DA|nr:FAD-dependent monooxygenase [Methylosinus sp. sav-2]TDX64296.1 2-octaprenyl-6-methoxyphenol hydroxylase [Methylosinus sp. sav-2]